MSSTDCAFKVFIGYDPREDDAYQVARYSMRRRASKLIDIEPLKLEECQRIGLYDRPISKRGGVMWDDISERPMSTSFSLSRFLVPIICKINQDTDWALFVDCDMLFLDDICKLASILDNSKAVLCTKHVHLADSGTKMDGQQQVPYTRKNWSSFSLYNCKHPSNKKLNLDFFNTVHRDKLHQFSWLEDNEIGDIPLSWNHLVGYPKPVDHDGMIYPQYDYGKPKNVHFTHGVPSMPGFHDCEYADEWRKELMMFNKALIEVKSETR